MYKNFAEVAENEGFYDIARLFSEVAGIEKEHEMRYLQLLNNIDSDTVFKKGKDINWVCLNCGYVYKGKIAPNICPVCSHPQSFFEQKCHNY